VSDEVTRELERELAEAKESLNKSLLDTEHWKTAAKYAQACSPVELIEQLTAHKAALEKCEKALNNFIPNNHSISDASRQIALAAIKQLKQQ